MFLIPAFTFPPGCSRSAVLAQTERGGAGVPLLGGAPGGSKKEEERALFFLFFTSFLKLSLLIL